MGKPNPIWWLGMNLGVVSTPKASYIPCTQPWRNFKEENPGKAAFRKPVSRVHANFLPEYYLWRGKKEERCPFFPPSTDTGIR